MNFSELTLSDEELRIGRDCAVKGSLMKSKQDALDLPDLRASSDRLAPKDGEEAAAYLRNQHTSGIDWFRKCLILQRSARFIPAMYPTAVAAQEATPESERVYKIKDLRRGMVAFCDDPNDSNSAGHIFFIAGRHNDEILTWSNDVKRTGGVDIVPLSFYTTHWGDKFQFGATFLNGYDFSDFNKPARPVKNFNTLGDRYEDAIDTLKGIRKDKEKRGADKMVRVLTRDIERMQHHLERYAG